MRRAVYVPIAAAAMVATLGLAACSSSSSSPSASSPSTFGVNATGVVHFWARQATDGPAKALMKEFNATHKNLKIVLHLTPPNDDTSQLATAIRAGSPPDVVGLNDIDVPTFSHEGALMNLTKYVDALPYKSALSPGHLALAVRRRAAARRDRRQLQHLRRRRRLRDPGRRGQPVGSVGVHQVGARARAQQQQYPSLGDTPVRSDILTPAFAAKNPYDAVALKVLAKGSVEYTLAYDAVYNEPGSPWFKMFEDAVYDGNMTAAIQEGQSGIQSTLDSVKS